MTTVDRFDPAGHPLPVPESARHLTVRGVATEIPARPRMHGLYGWTLLTVLCVGFEVGVLTAAVSYWRDFGVALFPWQMWALIAVSSASTLVCSRIQRAVTR